MTTVARAATTTPAPRAAKWIFAIAAAIGLFDLASVIYLRHASTDFIVARRERHPPTLRLGEWLHWKEAAPGALHGWARPHAIGTWSIGAKSALLLRLAERPPGDVVLGVWARAPLHPQALPYREVAVVVNGAQVARWRFDQADALMHRTARIPAALVGADARLRIELRHSEHRSLRELGIAPDTRRVGILVEAWRLDQ